MAPLTNHIQTHGLFSRSDEWKQLVVKADRINDQVTAILDATGVGLEETPRRPDVRIFVKHAKAGVSSANTITFENPENHGKGNKEQLDPSGDKTAMTIVPAPHGSLSDQIEIARYIVETLELSQGMTQEKAASITRNPALKSVIDKAYAPANFEDVAAGLTNLRWNTGKGFETITPVKHENNMVAYGCRDARKELAMRAEFRLFVAGTTTIAEAIENEGMVIAIDKHWQTGDINTKPIVPSVAKGYYGSGYDDMPVIIASPDGNVQSILTKKPEELEIKVQPSGEITVIDKDSERTLAPEETGLTYVTGLGL